MVGHPPHRAFIFGYVATARFSKAALVIAVGLCLVGAIGRLNGRFGWLAALASAVLSLAVAWVALRLLSTAALTPIRAVLSGFLGHVSAGRYAAAHAMLHPATQERTSLPDGLVGRFPTPIASVQFGRFQLTRNLNRGHPVRQVAKVAVRVHAADRTTADYVFLVAQVDGRWTVDDWLRDAAFDMIDYNPQ
jgi:hypothetical protein